MKIVRFNNDRVGILKNGHSVVDVSETIASREVKGPQRVIEEIIENFPSLRKEFERLVSRENGLPLSAVTLLVPIPQPRKCLAAFVNYLDRPDRSLENVYNEFCYKAPELLGPEGTIEFADIAPVLVFHAEAELAYVMGRKAKNVSEEKAMDYVFGYIPFFDISARGLTRRTQFLQKGQATYGPCGPWITTKDEIPNPHNLVVRSWVNGELRQNYSTKDMAHKIPDQIAWLSRFVLLQPGDVVATGTHHAGLGPINDGDVLEIEIEGMGRARFFVKGDGSPKNAEWHPPVASSSAPGGGMTKV